MVDYSRSDVPPGLSEMFINSIDTLQQREINQSIPNVWNDRPPLLYTGKPGVRRSFLKRENGSPKNKDDPDEEDPKLLKGMIRKGIPPSLRCAVWLSNIVQTCRTDQDLSECHEYRTLSKVRVVDGCYDSLWENDTKTDESSAVVLINRSDVKNIDFGNDSFWAQLEKENYPGKAAVQNILYALHHSVLGGIVDYAPILPTMVRILLGFMGESYAFYACREMYHHSAWFFATSRPEHIAMKRAFADILGRLHPHTLENIKEQDILSQYTTEIFQNFFVNIFPERMVLRLMDIYTLEGNKVLYRFGVALAVLYSKAYKEHYMYDSTEPNKWWLGLKKYCHVGGLNFEVLVKKAYGVHGRGVRKRFRFPRRPILSRIIEIEEENYRRETEERRARFEAKNSDGQSYQEDAGKDGMIEFYLEQIEPLGIVNPLAPTDPNKEQIKVQFAKSTFVRTKLAEWLPLSLRFAKLDLIYSTSYHGRTLENLYRCLSKSRHTIFILEPFERPENRDRYLIGMYASHTWHPSSQVYGDGRSFLFRIDLDDDKNDGQERNKGSTSWKWHPPDMLDFGASSFEEPSGGIFTNLQQSRKAALIETFQVSTDEFLSLGGNDEGGAGLRLNEDLTRAESSKADGFDNEPLLPNVGGMFEVGLVEVYQLVRQMDGLPVR